MAAVNTLPRSRFPFLTTLLVLATGMFYLTPVSDGLLVYEREKILNGELWRLFTGHLVHLSRDHFAYNVLLFAVSGCWLEYRASIQYYWLLAITALASSLYFLFFLPDMVRFGGLSGLASANIVLLSLLEIQQNRKTRPFWITILVLFSAKTAYEILAGSMLFVSQGNVSFEAVPSTHIIGAVIAAVLFFCSRRRA